jgi:hypothetical protein
MKKSPAKKPKSKKQPSPPAPPAPDPLPGNEDPPEQKEPSARERRELHKKLVAERAAKRRDQHGLDLGKDLFFEAGANKHWLRHQGTFRDFSDKILKSHLIARYGVSPHEIIDDQPALDWHLYKASEDRIVEYAGPIPGYRIGQQTVSGMKVLVTTEAAGVFDSLVEPMDARLTFFRDFIEALLPSKQWEHWCVSMAVSLKSLRTALTGAPECRPAPFDIYVGDANCGKSLLQFWKTQLLGGRRHSPAKAMMEGEKFTAGLLAAEHWTFGDPPGSSKMSDRLLFADKSKEFVHEIDFMFRGMHKLGIPLPCFRRVDGSFNRMEEDLKKIYPMRQGITDKTNLYDCADGTEILKALFPAEQRTLQGVDLPATNAVDMSRVKARISQDVPYVRAWLLHTYGNVPVAYRQTKFASRYGFDPFQHPALLRQLAEYSTSHLFMSYVDELLFFLPDGEAPASNWKHGPVRDDVECTADELTKFLQQSKFKDQLKETARSTSTVGRNLGDYMEAFPDRISKVKFVNGGNQLWRITNPYRQQNGVTNA